MLYVLVLKSMILEAEMNKITCFLKNIAIFVTLILELFSNIASSYLFYEK